MQDDDLFAERPPDDQQWFDQYSQVGKVLDLRPRKRDLVSPSA
jgi:hypothetical protein